MKKTLAWKDARLGWKMLVMLTLIILALPFVTHKDKDKVWVIGALALMLNSSALFRGKELDTHDFFLYATPVSRARFLASKLGWAAFSTIIVATVCVLDWVIIDSSQETLNPYWNLPLLLLPTLVPIVMALYFRSSQITTLVVSFVVTVFWGFVAVMLCPCLRLSLGGIGTTDGMESHIIRPPWNVGWGDSALILLGIVAWSFYLFCRTAITEKSHSKSAFLGIEFIFLFAWFAFVLLGANYADLWYLLFG